MQGGEDIQILKALVHL